MKVVIDTNVIISGIFFGGHPNRILEHWLTGNIELIITIPILTEYRRVIREITKKYGKIEYKQWNKYLTEFTTIIEPIKIHSDCRDKDDIKFLEAAVSGKVDYLISGDNDLLVLNSIHNIPIIKAKEFLDLYIK